MANTDAAFGLKPVGHLNGSPWNGKVNMYYVPASYGTAIYVGDPVTDDAAAGAAGVTVNGIDVEGMPAIAAATAGSTIRGVVVGFLPLQSNLETLHNPASTARIALVCDDPDVIFEIQEDSVTSTVQAAEVGMNADFIYAAGSATTGRSAVELDSSSAVSTTANLRILGLAKRPGNILGSFAKWLVMINEHNLDAAGGN